MLDLIIVGAGPYGLATATQAQKAGLDYLLIGEPMKFWKQSMPSFMILRSPFIGSSLYDPDGRCSLEAFYRVTGREIEKRKRIPLKVYLQYIDWFIENAGLNVRPQTVTAVAKTADGTFRVTVDKGEIHEARAVVLAVGNPPFATIPEALRTLDRRHYSHTCELTDFSPYAGKRVLVVGAGQSALEACLGLIQEGATVELSHRQSGIYWHNIPLRINVPLLLFFISFPTVLEWVPYGLRKAVGDRVSEPTVDTWLQTKVEGRVKGWPRTDLRSARAVGNGVEVTLSSGQTTTVDHIVLGTGYRVDLSRLSLLDTGLQRELQIRDGYPVLDRDLESNVPGLFFNGVPAKGRFGPTFNFIFASPAGAQRVIGGVSRRLAS